MSVGSTKFHAKRIFEDILHKSIFLSLNNFFPEEGFYVFMTAQHWCFFPPFISLPVFDVLHNPAFGYNVFWETDERKWFIHQTKAQGTNPSWPADHMVDIADLPLGRRQATLIRAFSGAWSIGSHLSRSDSVWQQTQAGLTAENVYIASTNSNVKADKELQGL